MPQIDTEAKRKQNQEEMQLAEFISNPWYKKFFDEVLNEKIATYQRALETVAMESHKIVYSTHDVNRRVLQIIRDLQLNPHYKLMQLLPDLAEVTVPPYKQDVLGSV